MNIKKLLILAPVAVLSLTSCMKSGIRHVTEDYFLQARHFNYKTSTATTRGLRILQLSDLHLGTNCDRTVQYAFIQKTINKANDYVKELTKDPNDKIDFIVITGDVFTFGTKEIAKDFCSFMEKQKIDWTMTFGNHDEQCYFSVDWLTGYLNDLSAQKDSYLLFKDNQDDDVFGNANFVISVPDDSNEKKEAKRLFIFDSNRYRYQLGSYGYDCIHYDQIDWYDRCIRYQYDVHVPNPENNVESLAFFHIPFLEFKTYYENAIGSGTMAHFAKDEGGTHEELKTQKEGVSCPKEHTTLFDKMREYNSNKGVFVGHDHINNSSVVVSDNKTNPMILSFGVKGTDTVYADDDLIGGQVIGFKDPDTAESEPEDEPESYVKIHPILHKYADLEVK